MSNLVLGRIICNDIVKIMSAKIDFLLTQFCIDNGFAIHFFPPRDCEKTDSFLSFQISDDFFRHYCESFLEPIIYTLDGEPMLDNISKDLHKLRELIKIIISFDCVEKIELRFSFIEVEEYEYETYQVTLEDMENTILKKYLEKSQMPVIKVIVNK